MSIKGRISLFCSTLLLFLAIWMENSFSREECPFAEIYANPLGKIGTMIACEGRIEKVISVGFPIGLIMKTEGYAWYAEIYKMEGIKVGIIKEGNLVRLEGQYISLKKVLYEGSLVDLPLIYVTKVGE